MRMQSILGEHYNPEGTIYMGVAFLPLEENSIV
jgi:hypothetical protein